MSPLPPLLLRGDCLAELRRIPDASVDSIVTDPPYGLSELKPQRIAQAIAAWLGGDRDHVPDARGFMGRAWDAFVPPPAVWDECLRILKPGGHLLAFAGSRTQDLMGLSIRLAGFEIRDSIAWLYGQGMPKSMDVSKAIDKMHGAEREVIASEVRGKRLVPGSDADKGGRAWHAEGRPDYVHETTAAATDDARAWEGWGTGLKPAHEPIIVARKPLAGTVAQNVLEYGTGALHIDATRIGDEVRFNPPDSTKPRVAMGDHWRDDAEGTTVAGRHPANVAVDEFAAAEIDAQAPSTGAAAKASGPTRRGATESTIAFGSRLGYDGPAPFYGDQGGASRFFYVSKAPKSQRPLVNGIAHPTVKPLALMRWLVRLVTVPGGVVVDPFAGSGTTGEAAYLEGFESILCEVTADYWPLIEHRIARATGGES